MSENSQKPEYFTDQAYKDIFENAVMGIYRSTLDGKHLLVNPALAHIYGYESAEALLFEMTDIQSQLYVDPGRRKMFIQLLEQTGTISNFESEIRQKNGAIIWIAENARIVKNGDGSILYVVGTVKDITGRKEIEQHLYTYQDELRKMASGLALTEEKERRKISAELHDSVGQTLAFMKMKLDEFRNHFTANKKHAAALEEIALLLKEAIGQTRSLVFDISPPVLYEMGLIAALEWLGERISQRSGLYVSVEHAREISKVPIDLSIIAFQSVRELLMNVVRHARAEKCLIRVSCIKGHMQILVKDDGTGFEKQENENEGKDEKFGLFSIHERLRHIGGVMEIHSENGNGSQVRLTLPLSAQYRKK